MVFTETQNPIPKEDPKAFANAELRRIRFLDAHFQGI